MFPQVAPKFFKSRAEGPKNLGKDPQRKSEETAAGKADGKGKAASGLSGQVSYVITLNGREHKVTVAPGN